jgi:hypothetical protein
VAYWTDIFTLETWSQAAAREFRVTGFPPPTVGKGGYSVGMCERSRMHPEPVSEEAARAASSALAVVDRAERLLDRDLEASDYAGVAAFRE